MGPFLFFLDFFKAHVERAKPRLDCASCSETWVGPSRKSSKIQEKTEVLLMQLPALTFSLKSASKGPPKGPVWGPLGPLLSLWRLTWSPKGAQSRQKGRPNEALESAQATRGARMLPKCCPRVPGTSKMEPTGSPNGPILEKLK